MVMSNQIVMKKKKMYSRTTRVFGRVDSTVTVYQLCKTNELPDFVIKNAAKNILDTTEKGNVFRTMW